MELINQKKLILFCIAILLVSFTIGPLKSIIIIFSILGLVCYELYLIFKKTDWAIIGVFLYSMFIKSGEDYLGIPHLFSYFVDIFVIFLLFKLLRDIYSHKITVKKNNKYLIYSILIFFGFCLITNIVNKSFDFFLFAWALRNNFRFFIFLIEATFYLNYENINYIKKIVFILLPINVLLSGIQLLLLDMHPDCVGGIFGCTKGVNGYLNIYLCLITVFLLVDFALEKISMKKTTLILLLVLLNASFAELKFYFFEFVFFIVLAFAISENRKRYFKIMIISFFVILLGVNILYSLFPFFNDFFSIEKIQWYLSVGYTNTPGEVNRLSAYSIINQNYLLSLLQQLFGIGFGMAETSSNFSFLQSAFYLENGFIRYDWFSHAFMYIEIGLIGTLLYLSIFIFCGYVALKRYLNFQNHLDKNLTFITIGIIITVFMNFIYNSSLRTEASYIIYLLLAIPYINYNCLKISKTKNFDKKISVVIPVYNVEKYINRCIDSVINQDYKNLEIILVNDGSTDKSGNICDEYSNKDTRIKVIHKKNGGLSDARNVGIDNATGDFISFVDSDDFISQDMYSFLINCLNSSEAKIAICDKTMFSNEHQINSEKKKSFISAYTMNSVEALKLLNQFNYMDVSMCDKIFEISLFENIRFPYGKKSEDSFVCFKLFDLAGKLIYTHNDFYFYYQREGSISGSANTNRNVLEAAEMQIDFFNESCPELLKYGEINFLLQKIWIYNSYIDYNKQIEEDFLINTQVQVKQNLKNILFYSGLSLNKKIVFFLFAVNPKLYKKIRGEKNGKK